MISHPTFIGTLSLSLISTFTHASPLQSRDHSSRHLHPRAIADYTSQGCRTEATRGRALTGNAYFDSLMTVEKCAAACTKFPLFGVEYGTECYCGNSFNPGSNPAPEEECSFQCPGNPDQKCGAGNRLNVYEKLVTAPVVTKPPVSTYRAEGCYTEAINGRALTGKTYYDDAMTTAKCASACAGFDLFGLEYYRECYCGNRLQSGSVLAPDNECFHPCTGDRNEICGGDNRLNLYTLGSGTTVTPPVSTPKSYVFDGCFTEATNSRALTGSVYYDNEMTIEKCSAVCKGYALFGVEFGRECYCGDTLQAGSTMTLESECNFPCPGNDAEFCGAGNRLNVYHFGAATSSSSSVATSSTATSSSAASSSSVTTSTETPVSTEMATTSTEIETSTTSTETPVTNTETSVTSTETPVSTEMATTSTEIETSPTSTETPVTSTETSVTSTESPATSTETSTTSTEISTSSTEIETSTTSTETSTTSTESPATSTETSTTSTEISTSSTEIETSTSSTETPITSTETSITSTESPPTSTETSTTSTEIDTTATTTITTPASSVSHFANLDIIYLVFDLPHNNLNFNLLNDSFDLFHNDHSHNLNSLNDFFDFFHNNFYRKQNLEYNKSDYHVIVIDDIISLHSFTHSGHCQPLFRTGRRLRALSSTMDFYCVLYGRTQSISSLSQTVNNLIRGKTYTLQYFYNVEQASAEAQCTFSVSIRDRVVDSFASPTTPSDRYIRRSVTYQNTDTTPAVLSFMLTCPRFTGQNGNNYALDAITLVTDRNGCS
ncbi:MAG: hypothetical protein Q9193_000701 [Seirophora villosa]